MTQRPAWPDDDRRSGDQAMSDLELVTIGMLGTVLALLHGLWLLEWSGAFDRMRAWMDAAGL